VIKQAAAKNNAPVCNVTHTNGTQQNVYEISGADMRKKHFIKWRPWE